MYYPSLFHLLNLKQSPNKGSGGEDEDEKVFVDEDDEEGEGKRKIRKSNPASSSKKPKEKKTNDDEEDEEEEIELDEQDVLEIAEISFEKIAQVLVKHKKTVRDHFKEFIMEQDIEGESIELLSPMGFIEGLAALECEDMTELEAKCLLHVLAKQQLNNAILVHELVRIMENFDIFESEKRRIQFQKEQEEEEGGAEKGSKGGKEGESKDEKNRFSFGNQQLLQGVLDENTKLTLQELTILLATNNMSPQELFEESMFKIKGFEEPFISSDDFFEILSNQGIEFESKQKRSLEKLLAFDPDNTEIFVVSKIL
jgi:hypothetical protein